MREQGRGGNLAISATRISDKVWDIKYELIKRHGVDKADSLTAPLEWYINTGRASAGFLGKLIDSDAGRIAGLLDKGGSTEKAITRIKEYLN